MSNTVKNFVKILIGIVLLIVGIVWYILPEIPILSDALKDGTLVPFWKAFLVLFVGVFGIGVFFIGLLMAWMSYEDFKMDREVKEEKKEETG